MTSAVAGYLDPADAPAPLADDALDDFLHDVVAAISGLPGELVRPRWQENPPNMPDRGITWCGVAVTDQKADVFAVEQPADDGLSINLIRHESLTVIGTFYGPKAGAVAGRLRDGLAVSQNREALLQAGMGLVEVGGPFGAGELIKEKWIARADLMIMMRREIRRFYPVVSLLSAHGALIPAQLASRDFDTLLITN